MSDDCDTPVVPVFYLLGAFAYMSAALYDAVASDYGVLYHRARLDNGAGHDNAVVYGSSLLDGNACEEDREVN